MNKFGLFFSLLLLRLFIVLCTLPGCFLVFIIRLAWCLQFIRVSLLSPSRVLNQRPNGFSLSGKTPPKSDAEGRSSGEATEMIMMKENKSSPLADTTCTLYQLVERLTWNTLGWKIRAFDICNVPLSGSER